MANDMNSAMDALKGILGDGAEDKIRSVMSSLSSSTPEQGSQNFAQSDSDNNQNTAMSVPNSTSNTVGLNADSLQYMMRMKSIIDDMSNTNDPRSNLLMSLKPYMRGTRRRGIDNAVKIMSLTKLTGFFK